MMLFQYENKTENKIMLDINATMQIEIDYFLHAKKFGILYPRAFGGRETCEIGLFENG